ncbi:MAG: APC family permease, partial [Mycobacterium sp.]|nr:APC family permease [Mycobacterium sp.]
SFSSGCAALTGVEAISNGVPAFRKPKSRNAATTLLLLGGIAVSLFMGIIVLAQQTGVQVVDDPAKQLTGAPPDYHQKTLVAQLAQAVFGSFHLGLLLIAAVTALILALAANTAFNGFPVLGSVLAQHSYLPRQLHTRGDRLAFSNGILFLSVAALAAIIAFRAQVTALIQLYIVGVFISFTLSQIGMVRHWTRLLRTETDPPLRRKMMRSRVINTIGFLSTGSVLLVVLVTKFLAGAWIAVVAMSSLFVLMKLIRKHYNTVSAELAEQAAADDNEMVLPSRNHAVVLVSKLHLPTLRALAYARATRPDVLEAVTVSVDDAETRALVHKWQDSDISVPLKVIASPYREVTRPVLDYVKRVSKESPRTVVTVFIPEYVVGHWWEQVLHNQSALRLKGRLLFMPGVMVTSVPWQLTSSERLKTFQPHVAPGDTRRGIFD